MTDSSERPSRLTAALSGRYRIERELGAGGMATVYLAHDERHDRKVAIKVLKPELAAIVGADRFLAEIRTTANLQHPHILPLHDSGEADGFLFYVMPYVEGESLRERIDRDRQLPVDEAVGIATKVAGALQAAHEKGVIHRDIKPANILLSKGEPLVADFGIALAVSAAGGGRLTETGLSLGTPYYMSPEQAAGEETIKGTTDIFSLGCVLYEMLAGEPPFTGTSAQAVLGKILSTESVSVTRARSATPPHVEAAVRKCLERLPADRFASMGALVGALGNPAFRHGSEGGQANAAGRVNRILVATTVALAAVVGWVLLRPAAPETDGAVRTYSLAVEPGREPTTAFDVSDDGRLLTLVMFVETEGVELFVRELGELEPRRLSGTAPGGAPAISPDGEEIVYYAGEELRIVPVAGGEPRRLIDAFYDRPDWGPDGSVYYVTPDQGIARIGREGGEPQILATPDSGAALRSPHLVAGTRTLLYTQLRRPRAAEIRSLDLDTGEERAVIPGTSPTVTASGHLLFGTAEGLMAVAFDSDRAEAVGTPVVVVPKVTSSEGIPRPYYRISRDGLLIYWAGSFADDEFVWVDRQGAARPVERGWSFITGDSNQGWDLSPDGRSILFREWSDVGYDLWVKEIDGGPPLRLTFDEDADERPHWSPDGASVTFVSTREPGRSAWQMPADGTGQPEILASLEAGVSTAFWAPGGEWLVLRTMGQRNTRGGRDLLALRPGADEPPVPIAAGPGDETGAVVSRDGRWIAYVSDETGQFEVFVRPFPDASGGRWQLTSNGGTMPLWAHNGREMFYVDLDHRVVQVSIDTSRGFRVTGERVLFPLDATYATATYRWTSGLWDITPDDQSFLMVRRRQLSWEERPQLIVVENFLQELERRVPGR